MKLLDQEYDKLAEEGASDEDLKRSKQENARLHALLRAPETIDTLCRDWYNIMKNVEKIISQEKPW